MNNKEELEWIRSITCFHCNGTEIDPSKCCATSRALAELDKACTESNMKDVEIARLRTTLEFYANPDNYRYTSYDPPYTVVDTDCGGRASKALRK